MLKYVLKKLFNHYHHKKSIFSLVDRPGNKLIPYFRIVWSKAAVFALFTQLRKHNPLALISIRKNRLHSNPAPE